MGGKGWVAAGPILMAAPTLHPIPRVHGPAGALSYSSAYGGRPCLGTMAAG